MKEKILLGRWTRETIDGLLRESSKIEDAGGRIDFLSAQFIKTPYKESTLIGDMHTPEVFVINLEGVDCLTFIEYIESMRRSGSFEEFRENLRQVRYRSGETVFDKRNHFFTDWKAFNPGFIIDVTKYAGAAKHMEVSKRLNEKQDGTLFLPGITCRLREVMYIQSIHVDDTVLGHLKTGDYIGIYAKQDGLDVSHVGIFIRDRDKVSLRHASSVKKYRKVIDEDFETYLNNKAGIIVFRPVTPRENITYAAG